MSISNSSKEVQKLFKEKFNDRVLFNAPLAPYVAYQIGGPADILLFPTSAPELDWLATYAKENNMPITIIGTGTNLLVHDDGVRGITLSLLKAFKNISSPPIQEGSSFFIECGGGVSKPELLNWAIQEGLQGLEFSAGVPGTVGGGIYMNAGTKYGSYADILKKLTLYDFRKGLQSFSRDELYFGYREQTAVKDSLVVSVVLELKKGDSKKIQDEVNRIIQERAEKQPLDYPSCGSTFKNPEGFSAGRLIEKAGLKGLKIGGAEISLKHANFILNKGGATASDIIKLIELIQLKVFELSGIRLETEVILIGGPNHEGKVQTKN